MPDLTARQHVSTGAPAVVLVVATDRDGLEQPFRRLTALSAELRRQMTGPETFDKVGGKNAAGVVTSHWFRFTGTPYRTWTPDELRSQLRSLAIPFASVTVTGNVAAPGTRNIVTDTLERAGLIVPTGDRVAIEQADAEARRAELLNRPWWQWALVIVAVLLGIGVAVAAARTA